MENGPESQSFSLMAPSAGDTELMGRIKSEAKAQLVAPQLRHDHNHITSHLQALGMASFPGKYGGNHEPGVVGSGLTCRLFLVAL